MAFFDQPELEARIRGPIGEQGKVDLRLDCEVTSVTDGADAVTLGTRDLADGAESSVTAAYVVACDGDLARHACQRKRWQTPGKQLPRGAIQRIESSDLTPRRSWAIFCPGR